MIRLRGRVALAAALCSTLLLSAGCGDDGATADRPAHRPISVIYVTGDADGPWGPRTTGLADGAKLAIAERNGLAGERAVSIAVTPAEQRDGETISAAIGGGRILRDSRSLAVLATYNADQLGLAAPQLNGGELPMIQFGSGMIGLTTEEAPGEPDRYEPSGERLVVRGVPADAALAAAIAKLPGLRGAQVVEGEGPSSDVPRLAARIATALGGSVRSGEGPSRSGPVVYVSGPGTSDRDAEARLLAKRAGPLVLVDAADRSFDTSRIAGRSDPTYLARRQLADPESTTARAIRARQRELFDRDSGDAVVAGYHATMRALDLAANQPERTIVRTDFAAALVADEPNDRNFPTSDGGNSTQARVVLSELKNRRWAPR